jgi:hypothetical protein
MSHRFIFINFFFNTKKHISDEKQRESNIDSFSIF